MGLRGGGLLDFEAEIEDEPLGIRGERADIRLQNTPRGFDVGLVGFRRVEHLAFPRPKPRLGNVTGLADRRD